MAARTRWTWTARESASYFGLADRMVMSAMVDSALRATFLEQAATGDTLHDVERLGTMARERAIAKLHVRFDTTLTRRLAEDWAAVPRPSRDSSLMAQIRVLGLMPRVAPSDTGRVLAHSADGDFRVRELIDAWARLDPLRRPRVDTPSQIQDLAGNGLYERILRRESARRKVIAWPAIAGALENEREYISVTHLVAREVYEGLRSDSVTLRRYYDQHRHEFALPLRVRVLELDLASREAATKMALDLRDPAHADSLIARGKRSGADYTQVLTAESDGARFERMLAAGTGAVTGPDSTQSGWSVSRVLEVIPARERTFEEAAPLVEHAWYGEEGERRMVQTLARLRRQVPVTINERAIQRLVREGAGPPPADAFLTPAIGHP
ncbi:MAG TPA: peptidylprolyl isomerase [Candidatus Udaeobacter sp.]|nr:peptidylprolyl isomerase [Candidatus Udaeobacter sp.]